MVITYEGTTVPSGHSYSCVCMHNVTILPPMSLSVQVGLFRKSGVKSRIQALRQMNESSGADGGGVNYEGQSAYDVADMLKQYFRDLPEPLLTSKLSETFLQIYQCKDTQTYIEIVNQPPVCKRIACWNAQDAIVLEL